MSIVQKAVQDYYNQARQPKFDPSELRLSETGDCPRKRVLKAMGHPATHPISDEGMRTMETGHLWEAWLVERIKAVQAITVETQVVVEAPYGASGHIDIVLTDLETFDRTIEEVKAVSQWTKVLPDPRHVD